jgi:membrane protein DedA with SNARE-associated domain
MIGGRRWRQFVVRNAAGGVSWVLTVGLAAWAVGETAQDAITALGLVGLAGLLIGMTRAALGIVFGRLLELAETHPLAGEPVLGG